MNAVFDRWQDAGVLTAGDCLIATRIARRIGEPETSDATLALAFAIRAVREGSTALDLADPARWWDARDEDDSAGVVSTRDASRHGSTSDEVAPPSRGTSEVSKPGDPNDHGLPEIDAWWSTINSSVLVAQQVMRVEHGLLYLDRYWADERLIATSILDRAAASIPPVDAGLVDQVIADSEQPLNDEQAEAVRSVANRAITILTGGPGMGKTFTIQTVVRALSQTPGFRVALAAPTGKAATRMNEALGSMLTPTSEIRPATTLHRLLGSRPDNSVRFRHNASDPLPHDLVIVDEASMVSLGMMARLLESLAPTTRLLLVGDPDQLAPVEAGWVLADLVRGLESSGNVVRLVHDYRMGDDRALLASAFRKGTPDGVLEAIDQAATGETVRLIETEEPSLDLVPQVVEHALRLRELALAGDQDAALDQLDRLRLLCAHRTGPFGTTQWNWLVERELAHHAPEIATQSMYVGRPILVTRNDHGLGLSNGDAGVIIRTDDGPVAAIATGSGPQRFSPWRLAEVETMHAMTVHKAQGSQADDVIVIVPPLDSKLLSRELLYTAVTRPQQRLTMIGTRESIAASVDSPIKRPSGLEHRLAQ